MVSTRRLVTVVVLAAAAVLSVPVAASAHPLGNFTVNVYSGLRVAPDRVDVQLVVDMAEIPTFQTRRDVDSDGDGNVSQTEASAYARAACGDATKRVALTVDGRPAALRSVGDEVTFPTGMAGLATLRLACRLSAGTPGEGRGERTLRYRNDLYTDRVGWREITAVGDGAVLVASDVPVTSVSAALTAYPNDLLQSPLDQRQATLRARPGGVSAAPDPVAPAARNGAALPSAIDRASRSFTSLVSRQDLTVGFGLLAVGLALLLGGVHAFAPGHGKTLMAAYLVGQRGSFRQAAFIGLTVTATHTAGVLILGIALTATTGLAPERLYPWLGLASGVLVMAIGISLLLRARRGRSGSLLPRSSDLEPARELVTVGAGASGAVHTHDHHSRSHSHGLGQHSHTHPHPDGHPAGDPPPPLSRRSLLAMGLAGGMVPTPSALVVLLGAIALGRAWFGVVLVVAYGVGMAATLTGAGLVLVRARAVLERRLAGRDPGKLARVAALLPVVTAAVIVAVGLFLALRGAAQL